MISSLSYRLFPSSFFACFIVSFLIICGLANEIPAQQPFVLNNSFPDFGQYVHLRTLSAHEFPFDHPQRRVLLVGDIHGMYRQLKDLLEAASYNGNLDVLIHVGDVVTKGVHKYSMKTLEYLSSNHIIGVRGNHEQKVIEWRAWLDWMRTCPNGDQWLLEMHSRWMKEKPQGKQLKRWLRRERRRDNSEWWHKIPRGWKLFDGHFRVAYDMTEAHYNYLRSLPLVLYIPSAHAYIVHAGLLPFDLIYPQDDPRQPLAHIPLLPPNITTHSPNETEALLRHIQELCILNDIPQNTVPWNILNMRTIRNGKISKKTHGKKWLNVWNHVMDLCHGFKVDKDDAKGYLPCFPSTIIYGHFAARGLDSQRWSIGLDSGCVSGHKLTILILESVHKHGEYNDIDSIHQTQIPFGENGRGKFISVACS